MTGLILVEGAAEDAAVTLAALVPAVVAGLMGDAVILSRQADPALATVAESAGASLVIVSPGADPWRAGAAQARREWLLCLRGGELPGEGWMRAVERFLVNAARADQPLGRFGRRRVGPFLLGLIERAAGTRRARAGDLVRRDWLTARRPARVRPMRIGATIEQDIAVSR